MKRRRRKKRPTREITPTLPPDTWWLQPGHRIELVYGEGRSRTRGKFRVGCVAPPAGGDQKLVFLRKPGTKAQYLMSVQAYGATWIRSPVGKVYQVTQVLRDGVEVGHTVARAANPRKKQAPPEGYITAKEIEELTGYPKEAVRDMTRFSRSSGFPVPFVVLRRRYYFEKDSALRFFRLNNPTGGSIRGRNRIRRVFRALSARARSVHPQLGEISFRRCLDADKDHAALSRNYMHVGHYPNTICYASATGDLSLGYQTGLIVHEIGHLVAMSMGMEHGEEDANNIGTAATGIPVEWRGLQVLEWSEPPAWIKEAAKR